MARRERVFYAARPVRFLRSVILALVAAQAAACAPQIGDSCSSASNCSINGDRLCDIAQPGGYCTVFDCEPDRCPDDSVCVRFNPQPARRAIVACMRRCGSSGDCREDDGYRCVSAEDLAEMELEVEVRDTDVQRFCVAVDAE
ncbi:Hypothetical protein I5071_90770 [Sandaracinus amylolyticus]|nr:Hypothetical protein I5071_90770 [Sandaracinus amylolyticus]